MTKPSALLLGLLAATLPALVAAPLRAQQDGVRVGLTVGGTGFLGVSVELLEGHHAVELTVGTWSFDDLTLSVVGREYFGASALRPVVGLGLWLVTSRDPEDPRRGATLVLRAPVGFDWRAAEDHFVSVDLNVNRALWLRRGNPDDTRPAGTRLVPLPGLTYRWQP